MSGRSIPTYVYPLSVPATIHRRHKTRMRVAKRACRGMVEGHLCGDVWEVVSYDKRGRITGVRCMMHGHRHHWGAKKLLLSLRQAYRTLPRTKRRGVTRALATFKTAT